MLTNVLSLANQQSHNTQWLNSQRAVISLTNLPKFSCFVFVHDFTTVPLASLLSFYQPNPVTRLDFFCFFRLPQPSLYFPTYLIFFLLFSSVENSSCRTKPPNFQPPTRARRPLLLPNPPRLCIHLSISRMK